jgi:hypothetical protein
MGGGGGGWRAVVAAVGAPLPEGPCFGSYLGLFTPHTCVTTGDAVEKPSAPSITRAMVTVFFPPREGEPPAQQGRHRHHGMRGKRERELLFARALIKKTGLTAYRPNLTCRILGHPLLLL